MVFAEWQVGQVPARGNEIGQHHVEDAQEADQARRAYIRSTVGSPADDPTTLADLRERGVIDDAGLQIMKDRVVST